MVKLRILEKTTHLNLTESKERKKRLLPFLTQNKVFPYIGGILVFALIAFASVLIYSHTTDINVNNAVSANTNLPSSLNAYAGDYYEYNIELTNKANQPSNYSLYYSINTNSSIVNGDVKLQIINASGIVVSSTTDVYNNTATTRIIDERFDVNQNKKYNLSVQFNIGAPNATYHLIADVVPGSFAFK